MTTPSMKGFSTQVPYSGNEFLDSDGAAFRLPVVEPGGSVTNYSAWWYNFGYSFLYNGQLSLVVGGTMDSGADADTIDVMNIGAPYGANWLNHATPATAANTTTWTYPMQDPFRPFIDKFAGGVKWNPPIGAATGIIRKCFQWDGSYYPDTWDYIWYPISNGYYPDSTFYTYPMTTTLSNSAEAIELDTSASTGYKLKLTGVGNIIVDYKHFQAGDPWYDSVNNATGYVIDFSSKTGVTANTPYIGIAVYDGSYTFIITIEPTGISISSGSVGGGSWAYATTAYNLISVRVKGTLIEIYVDGTQRITDTLNSAHASKQLLFGGSSFMGNLDFSIDYIKYFLNGNTPPVH